MGAKERNWVERWATEGFSEVVGWGTKERNWVEGWAVEGLNRVVGWALKSADGLRDGQGKAVKRSGDGDGRWEIGRRMG